MIFNSLAFSNIEAWGALNFFGERQTQSQVPVSGYTPEVSTCVFRAELFNEAVSAVRSYITGSPPVTTTISVPLAFARLAISSTVTIG